MSCLFESLAFFMINNNSEQLRQEICNYLLSNPNLVDDISFEQIASLDGINREQYVSEMRKNQTWGGAIEIKAFCDMYHINVQVVMLGSNENKSILFEGKDKPNRFLRITYNGNHYEPLPNKV